MKLYFSPLTCSLATRISLYEAGIEADYVEVDPHTKQTADGVDFTSIHPLGLVPALRTDEGELLTESAAILQYVADRHPQSELAPRDAAGRTRLHQWLSFVGTELHKAVFDPLLSKTAPPEAKTYALAKAAPRFEWLASKLQGRTYLLERFSVADAYLTTILNWTAVTPLQLRRWPALAAYHEGLRQRASIVRALADEKVLYVRELQRHGGMDALTAKALGVAPGAEASTPT